MEDIAVGLLVFYRRRLKVLRISLPPPQTTTAPLAFFTLPSLRHINQTDHVIAACATNITAEKMKPLWNLGASTAGNTR
jgi:hypothetical protein